MSFGCGTGSRRSGYPKATVKYDVAYHSKHDVVDVTFVVRAGPPLMLDSLDFAGDSGALDIPPDARHDWARFVQRERKTAGRFGEDERRALADSTWRWFSAHGYPFARARTIVAVDTAANTADVIVQAYPDIRAKVREVEVKGNQTAPPHHYARQLPVSRGQWYDGAALERGREQLTQMDLVRLALVDVPRNEARDSTVAVRLNVTENPPHLIRGEVGIQAGGGLSTQTDWTDRSVFNGLRTLTVTGIAQTGLLALESPSEQLYRLNLTLFQPYVGTRTLSAAGGPFGEYRNDIRDRSLAAGFEGSLVYAPAQFRSLSLGYSISYRRIYNFGFGENLDPSVYLPLLGLATPAQAGTLDKSRDRSVVSLEGSYGRLDRIADPRQGYVLRPRVEITTPYFNTSEYLLLDMTATAFVPLSKRVGFTFRAGAGRIFPYGNSLDNVGSESPFVSLLRLRDVTFTAGGTRDVRGWGSQLVGPKLPGGEVRIGKRGNGGYGGRPLCTRRWSRQAGRQRRAAGSSAGIRGILAGVLLLRHWKDLDPGQPLRAECRRARPGQDLCRRRRGSRVHDGRRSAPGSGGIQAQSVSARPAVATGRARRRSRRVTRSTLSQPAAAAVSISTSRSAPPSKTNGCPGGVGALTLAQSR